MFKIEKADPPRKISLDEFLAFAEVFGLTPEDLMAPPPAADEEVAARLVEELGDAGTHLEELGAAYGRLLRELATVHPELSERYTQDIVSKLRHQFSIPTPADVRRSASDEESSVSGAGPRE